MANSTAQNRSCLLVLTTSPYGTKSPFGLVRNYPNIGHSGYVRFQDKAEAALSFRKLISPQGFWRSRFKRVFSELITAYLMPNQAMNGEFRKTNDFRKDNVQCHEWQLRALCYRFGRVD